MRTPKRSRMREPAALDMGLLPGLLGYAVRQAELFLYHEFQAALGEGPIRPPHFAILEMLRGNPGVRPSDMAQALGISRANLVPLVSELRAMGFVERWADQRDGRAQALRLTAAGVVEIGRLHELLMPRDARLAARLGPGGRERLLELLGLLVAQV